MQRLLHQPLCRHNSLACMPSLRQKCFIGNCACFITSTLLLMACAVVVWSYQIAEGVLRVQTDQLRVMIHLYRPS